MRLSVPAWVGCWLVSLSGSACTATPVAETMSQAVSADGQFISWREHRIDDPERGNLDLSGSDGLAMADLDLDGFEDIISVHESDTVYDGKPIGHVRIAWGTGDPHRWRLATLAAGIEAAAAEDVSIADANGDGYPDVVVACELAHLVYFQNPGNASAEWARTTIPITLDRGSYIRVFFADLDGDGHPEVVAPNKGEQNPEATTSVKHNLSVYLLPADPMDALRWREQVLTRVRIPINSEPVDIDGDGDLDVIGGSRGERRLIWLENRGALVFAEHPVKTSGSANATDPGITGFNMDYADLNGDGRTDIIVNEWPTSLVWLAQPETPDGTWELSVIGDFAPDQLVSVRLADIDNDGDLDAFAGSYSRGARDRDDPSVTANDPLGRIGWFENPGIDQASGPWKRHDISRRKRGMYDKWIARDLDNDGDMDFIGTRGNSEPYDGVIWLEQVRSDKPAHAFTSDWAWASEPMPLPDR